MVCVIVACLRSWFVEAIARRANIIHLGLNDVDFSLPYIIEICEAVG